MLYFKDFLSKKNNRAFKILIKRSFVFDKKRKTSLSELAKEFGITRERVRQIEAKTIEYLKKVIQQYEG